MINIFRQDKEMDDLYKEKPIDFTSSVQMLLEERYKNSVTNRIKIYQNSSSYSIHFDNELIKERVNNFFSLYNIYLDAEKIGFLRNFRDTYGEKVFELTMANFIGRRFKLKERTAEAKIDGSLPDLEFVANGNTYFLECTTRFSTLIPEYINILPKFNNYSAVAKVFYRQNEQFKTSRRDWCCEWWYDPLIIQQDIWLALDDENKKFVWKKLGFYEPVPKIISESQLAEFRKWIKYNRYMLTHFVEALPSELVKKLNALNLRPGNSTEQKEESEFQDLLVRFVAQGIISKLDKKYFHENHPVIVSVSLSLLTDFKMLKSPKQLIEHIAFLLPEAINDIIQDKINEYEELSQYNNFKNKVEIGLQNLYAVIIDTTWFNWFPDICEAKMPDGYDNCYGVIYNTNISREINKVSDKNLFVSQIPYQMSACLKVD